MESGRLRRREYENQIEIVGDAALSDHHSTIQWHNNMFILGDFNSRYGTLVMEPNRFSRFLAMSNSPSAQAARHELNQAGIPAQMKFDATTESEMKAQKAQRRMAIQVEVDGFLIDVERVA